jgi:transposase
MGNKRCQYNAEFKLDTVMEGIRGEEPVAQICRERHISDSLYYKWCDMFKEHAQEIFNRQDQKDQVVSEQEARIADLERMVGKLELENEILKKAVYGLNAHRCLNTQLFTRASIIDAKANSAGSGKTDAGFSFAG